MTVPAEDFSPEESSLNEEVPASGSDNRRQLKHFFVKPRFQLQYVNWIIAGAFFLLVSTVVYIHLTLSSVDHLLNVNPDAPLTDQVPVYNAFSDITMIALGGFVTFIIFTCAVVLLINHRVAGPMHAIVDHIDQLRQGNYGYKRELRENDDLAPINEALKNLAVVLAREKRQLENKKP